MNDRHKTKAELIEELKQLRKEVNALKTQKVSGPDKSYLATLNLLEDLQNEIHDRKKIETALTESDRRLRSFIQHSLDSVFCYEYTPPIPVKSSIKKQIEMLYNGVLIECNDAGAKSIGSNEAKDIIGRTLTESFQITRESFDDFFRQFIKNNYQSINQEGEEILPDGSKRYFLNSAYGVIENNKLIRIWGIYHDITEERLASLAFQQSEKRYRDLVELLPQTIFEMDIKGNITYINTHGMNAFGYTKSDVKKGLHLSYILPPEELQRGMEQMRLMLGGKGKTGNEYHARKKDGSPIDIRVYNAPVYKEGKHIGWRGTVLDITSQIKATKQIHESEELYRELFEAESDAIFLIQNDTGQILQANKAASKLYGYSRKELLTMKNVELSAEPEKTRHITESTPIIKDNVVTIPLRYHKKKNGKVFIVEITGRFFEWKGLSVHIAAIRDITQRKQNEQALQFRLDFEHLISNISSRFINIPYRQVDHEIHSALKAIAKFANAVRSSLFLISKDSKTVTNTHEWCADPADSQKELLQSIPFEKFGYYKKSLLQLKTVCIENWNDLPVDEAKQERTWARKHGFRSLLFIPLSYSGNLSGALGFYGKVHEETKWSREFIVLLELVGHIIMDALKRKETEEALRHEHDFLRSITETSPIGITQVNADGEITYANKRAEKILHLKKKSITHRTYNAPQWRITDYNGKPFPEKDLPFNQVRKTGKSVFDVRHAIQLPGGKRLLLSINASPIHDKEGKFESMVASIEDRTERVHIDTERLKQQQRYEQLFNTMLDGYALHEIICNKNGKPVDYRFLDINPAFENLTGLKGNVVIGKTVLEVLPGTESYWIEKYGRVALTGEPLQFENYSGDLNKYFQVTAFSTQKGQFASIFVDITQQKIAEQALRQNEAQLSIASQIAKLGYWEYNVDEDLFTFNDPFYAIFRTSGKEVGTYKMPPEQYARQFLHPDDRPIIAREMKKALGTRDPNFSQTLEHRIIYADGKIGYISVHYFVVKDKKGRTIKTYGANQDITERKRAEEALRESERRMRNVLETIKMVAVSLDIKGNITFVNDFLLELTGYKKNEVIGKNWFGTFIPQEIKNSLHDGVFEGTLKNNNFPPYHENEIITKKNQRRLIAWNNTVLHYPGGKIIGVTSIGADITEQRQAEENLKRQNVFIQTILDNLPIGLAVNTIDDGKTTYMNRKFEEIYGWPFESLQSVSDFFKYVFPDPEYRKIIENRVMNDIGSGDPERMEWDDIEATGQNGTKHIISAKNIPLPDQNIMISTVQDITAEKHAEREKQRHREELQQLSTQLIHTQEEERRKLSRELHDEMGQALTGIKLNMATVKNQCAGQLTPLSEERLNETDQLVEDLLSQLHDIALDLRPSMLDDLGLIPTLNWLMNKLNKRQKTVITLTIQDISERLMPEYETALYRVIQECLNNITRHAQAKKVRIQLKKTKANKLKLTIKDDGRGFDIWELEQRDPTKRGIGIIGMQERIALLKGEIRIESCPGEGTVVTVHLPLNKN